MKKITKVLFTAAAVSLLCFAGCKNASDALGEDFITYTNHADKSSGAEATAYIDYTNEDTEEVKRGLRFFNNNKKDIAMNVVMENAKDESGFMSVIFNKTENKIDGTFNFIALGYNSKGDNNTAKIACTYYQNVSTADFGAVNFGRTGDECKELMLGRDDKGFAPTNIAPDADGKLNVGFVITAKKGEIPYEVRVYKDKTAAELNQIADDLDKGLSVAAPESLFSISDDVLGLDRTAESGKIDAGIGFYANVYAKKTLKGQWQVGDISHNPDGIIWEDEISNTLNIQLAE